jgi:hypothetical protein
MEGEMIALSKRIERLEKRANAVSPSLISLPLISFSVGGGSKDADVRGFLRSCGHDVRPNHAVIHFVGVRDDAPLVDLTNKCGDCKPEQDDSDWPEE